MGGLASAGGGKGGGGGGGGGGLSGFDIAALEQAVGQNIQMLHNRYAQLGLGTPDPGVFGGDPATAAKAGGSLAYGGPGTAEQTDIQGQQNVLQAGLGQLQVANAGNAGIPGSFANIAQNQSNLANLAGQAQFGSGFQSQGGTVG